MGWTRQEVLDVARSTGRPVVEAWSAHDAGQMGTVLGPMLHHTGSPWSYPTLTAPTLRTVREGRSDLQNSLCMYYIDYAGVIYCVSEKLSWHAGAGSWAGVTDGNGHFAGIEAESDGVQWTKPTVASYKRLAAAILRKTGRTVAYAPRHADYALPKGRKNDFAGMDPVVFLADVNAELTAPPLPPEEDDDMASIIRNADDGSMYLAAPGFWQPIPGPAYIDLYVAAGLAKTNRATFEGNAAQVAHLRAVCLSTEANDETTLAELRKLSADEAARAAK